MTAKANGITRLEIVHSFIKDRKLKAKLYREETLTLNQLTEIVSQYHDKEAFILVTFSYHIAPDSRQGGKCWQWDSGPLCKGMPSLT